MAVPDRDGFVSRACESRALVELTLRAKLARVGSIAWLVEVEVELEADGKAREFRDLARGMLSFSRASERLDKDACVSGVSVVRRLNGLDTSREL